MTKEKKKKYAKINSADYYFEAALKKWILIFFALILKISNYQNIKIIIN
jgi:hypothetical protein